MCREALRTSFQGLASTVAVSRVGREEGRRLSALGIRHGASHGHKCLVSVQMGQAGGTGFFRSGYGTVGDSGLVPAKSLRSRGSGGGGCRMLGVTQSPHCELWELGAAWAARRTPRVLGGGALPSRKARSPGRGWDQFGTRLGEGWSPTEPEGPTRGTASKGEGTLLNPEAPV